MDDFVPNETAASQKDFVYASAKGNYVENSDNPVNLVFKHALAEISIKAKNANTDYKVQITGLQLGKIVSKATFRFPQIIRFRLPGCSLARLCRKLHSDFHSWEVAIQQYGMVLVKMLQQMIIQRLGLLL
ncbi:hypothetical protein DXB51_28625 [Bacillus cereus]|nr:hypothetical protein DXB51_28625 [Bacillus cereus]